MSKQLKKQTFSQELQERTTAALEAKQRILNYLEEHSEVAEGVEYIRACLKYTDISYEIFGEELPEQQLDRTSSLIGVHLYVSEKFPSPKRADGKAMLPVLQLDTKWINELCDKKLEACLLQFWWDSNAYEGFLRKIPLSEVRFEELKSIEIEADLLEEGSKWIDEDWTTTDDGCSFQLLECIPIGVTYPDIEVGRDWMRDDSHADAVPQELWDDLDKFTFLGGRFTVDVESRFKKLGKCFGEFYAAQASAVDMPHDGCLINMSWSSGYGSIFYKEDKKSGGTEFVFYFDN